MARIAFLGLLAFTCAMALGSTEAPTVDSIMAGLEATPFQEVPGGPVGAKVYKEVHVEGMTECSSMCAHDDDCSAYQWDEAFGECQLMRTDMDRLARQNSKLENQVLQKEAKAAEATATTIEKAKTEEEAKEKADIAKVEKEPLVKALKSPTSRDTYRKAARKEKESKVLLRDRAAAKKELAQKVAGTATVERIAKRHQQDVLVKFNAEQKVFSAAMLNMEEQVMIRGDRNSKEVVLARGAKEEAEVKFDKIHRELLQAKHMQQKAVDMNAALQKQGVGASQALVQATKQAETAQKALKEAQKGYRAAEISQKDAADLKKRQAAAIAKTYLKNRDIVAERDARARESSVLPDYKKVDKANKDACLKQQEKLKEAEVQIKQELEEEIGNKERAASEKQIRTMTRSENEVADRQNARNLEKLVKKANEQDTEAAKKAAVIAAKEQATSDAAARKQAVMTKVQKAAHKIREATNKRIASLVEEGWQRKKTELGLISVDCQQPALTTEDRLRATIKSLQSQKLTPQDPPPMEIDPVAEREIEDRVRQQTKSEFSVELEKTKKEMKEKMDKELQTQREAMEKEKEKLEKKASEAKAQLEKAKKEADESQKEAKKAETKAEEAVKDTTNDIPEEPKQ